MLKWLRSLQAKLLAITLITVCGFTALFVWHTLQNAEHIFQAHADEYGLSLAEGIATSLADLLREGNYLALDKSLRTIGSSYETIHDIEIIVSNVRVGYYGTARDTSQPTMISEQYSAAVTVLLEGRPVELGVVNVRYFLNRYYDNFVRQLRQFLMTGGAFLIITALILFLVINGLIIRPVAKLRSSTHIIGAGNLTHQIQLKRRDELGELAQDFNLMTQQLKSSRDEIEEWNRTLEHKVALRTAQLKESNEHLKATQYQLIQSGKMAAIGLIGAGVAHELNNPLTCIIGYSQLSLEHMHKEEFGASLGERCQRYFERIEKESQRCKRIVDNLLYFSKTSDKDYVPVEIQKLVDNTFEVMEYQIRRWNITTKTDFPPEPVMVRGNSDKLQQVFINLLANAHNAMPDGGTITVRCTLLQEHEPQEVEIAISDTGCGIPPDNLERLFSSFFSTKKEAGNLGLGLSLTHQIVKEHGGMITVESEVGKGTTFKITLLAA